MLLKLKETLSSDRQRGNEVVTSVSAITIVDGKNIPYRGFSPNWPTGGQVLIKISITTINCTSQSSFFSLDVNGSVFLLSIMVFYHSC